MVAAKCMLSISLKNNTTHTYSLNSLQERKFMIIFSTSLHIHRKLASLKQISVSIKHDSAPFQRMDPCLSQFRKLLD